MRAYLPYLRLCCLAFYFLCCAADGFSRTEETKSPNYSKESFVIEKFSRKIVFAEDGTSELEQTAVIKVQSEAGVREFGVLSFAYNSENERLEVAYIRVRKPDGSLVSTPESNMQDVSSPVTRAAPTYSDLREKQIPVKALSTGDTLEYLVRILTTKPEVPHQFWYSQNFLTDAVVLGETLQITVPAGKYVKVSSPVIKPEVREEQGRKTYFWKTSQTNPTQPKEENPKTVPSPHVPVVSVQLTTFKSWEEVGRWYEELQDSRTAITPAIKAKATELTKGLTQDVDKERALYNYVGTKFRYISLSFGQGRYQPHTAEEILSNQYGDCKDKHTLFATLLKAAGIPAWPALIGAGMEFDPELPSPGQFNHVITVIPNGKSFLWLDTTPEVAPFGVLQHSLRDKQALVVSSSSAPGLTRTPIDLPIASLQVFDVKATLNGEGTLKGHFDVTLRGDLELIVRSVFHELSPAQWQPFLQSMSYQWGFAGTVNNVSVDNVEDLTKPLHYSYDYVREQYSDWQNRRITPPMPPFGFPFNEESEKPAEPVEMGSPGEVIYRATINLPAGYSLEIPEKAHYQTDFAEYQATYSAANGVLTTERRMRNKVSKIPVAAWSDYLNFEKAVVNDESQFVKLASASASSTTVVTADSPEAQDLLRRAYQALQGQDTNSARDLLAQAERINPKQTGLWAMYSYLHTTEHEPDKGVDALRKEIQNHPDEKAMYQGLTQLQLQMGRRDDAVETLRLAVQKWPDDTVTVLQLASIWEAQKRYADILPVVQKALTKNPDNAWLQGALTEALLYTGRKEEGLASAQKLAKDTSDNANSLNTAAYALADTRTNLPLSREYAEKSVALIEERMKVVTLVSLTNEDLRYVDRLSSYWDTLGWAYFQLGEYAKAEKYLKAAWTLSQYGVVGDHLGTLYEKQGRREAAIHTWRLALASNSGLDEAREHLRMAGASPEVPLPVVKGKTALRSSVVSPGEELGKLRTTAIPSLPMQEGSAEFFVLFSENKVEDVQFISGKEQLKAATNTLSKAGYKVEFPDDGPEKIPRRGILSCSKYTTPSCQFTFLLPSTTKR